MYDFNEFLETLKTTRVYNHCTAYLSHGYEFCIIYLVWIVLHYIASHLYTRMCTHFSLIGFISSPFLVPAPHCQSLRWLIYKGGEQILAMWVFFGGYLLAKINSSNKKPEQIKNE